jgi:hypothetical protein
VFIVNQIPVFLIVYPYKIQSMRIVFIALSLMLFITTLHAQNLWQDPGPIGIGTKSPAAPLHIANGMQQITFATGTCASGYILSMGVNDDGININNNSYVRGFNFKNGNGLLFSINQGGVVRATGLVAFFGPGSLAENVDNTSKRGLYVDNGSSSDWTLLTLQNAAGVQMRVAGNGNVGIGTLNPKGYKLAVAGTIGGRSVKVTQETWADFVFHRDYKLPALSEVADYIEKNAHLPGIPTESEVKENGIDLGEMNKLLLQKVEEQMLYIIQLSKQVQELSQKVNGGGK